MPEPIKIFVADDHPVVREGLIAVLEAQPDFVVAGEAADGQEAINKIANSGADVVLLDLSMPHKDGIEVIQHLRTSHSPARVIVFTVFDSDDRIIRAVQAGAKGYLLKGASRQEIFHAIRVVHEGGSLLQPSIASKLVQHLSQPSEGPLHPRNGGAPCHQRWQKEQRGSQGTVHL